ncbi:hypothetical protein CSOJ01_14559 [Colletotrichum sojae]|uniref:Uncharacterized protein n=1 Tax=Colletotrichum sojae TaxID=2175907 RepID=A0A8H6IQB0_9PEZI|nr:hypothetical protein CSOJ01_14559 [Colletotrichum sojae]
MKYLTLILATIAALAAAAPISHTNDDWKSPVVPKDAGKNGPDSGKTDEDRWWKPTDSDKNKPDTPWSNPKDDKSDTPTKDETPSWPVDPKSETPTKSETPVWPGTPSKPDSAGVGKPVYDQWGAPVASHP